jgi:hypothetical protein
VFLAAIPLTENISNALWLAQVQHDAYSFDESMDNKERMLGICAEGRERYSQAMLDTRTSIKSAEEHLSQLLDTQSSAWYSQVSHGGNEAS